MKAGVVTVAELIAELSRFPGDRPVLVGLRDPNFGTINDWAGNFEVEGDDDEVRVLVDVPDSA